MNIKIENEYLLYVIDDNGNNLNFIDKKTGIDYCSQNPVSACAKIKMGDRYYDASLASYY